MLAFIRENLGTIIVGAAVLLLIILAVIKLMRDKACSCSCSGCSGCAGYDACNMSRKKPASKRGESEKSKSDKTV